MFRTIFIVSVTTSVLIALLLCFAPLLDKRYSARWRYFIWLIIALRLVIPWNPSMPRAPIQIPVAERQIEAEMRIDDPEAQSAFEYREEITDTGETVYKVPIISWNDLIFYIWLIVAVGVFLFHMASYFRFRLAIRKSITPTAEKNVYHCSEIDTPLVVGFIHPMILLPENCYTERELEFILAHERTHLRRGDLWYKLLLVIVRSVHWWNPIVWLMTRQANRDLEYSCDSIVVKGKDMDYRKEYSMTILKYTRTKAGES